jgi:riboflavin synthase
MFTGIVEELGIVKGLSRIGNLLILEISSAEVAKNLKIGDSVSVNGVCLTVVNTRNSLIKFEVMAETSKTTNLGLLKINEKVNLESSLKLGDKVSGHFVLGHVDCLGVIRRKGISNGNTAVEIAVPNEFIKYCLPKGSIAIDGISLTIQGKKANLVILYIIPHTLKNTALNFKGPSDKVNIEFDILAKRAAA